MARTRRTFLTTTSLAFAGLAVRGVSTSAESPAPRSYVAPRLQPRPAVAAQAPAQAPPPAPPPRFEDLRRGVGVFTGRGGTIAYLLTPDGALVVDSQYADTASTCLEGLKPKAPKGIELLINTHHHADHTGGNLVFKPAVERIVAHVNCVTLQRQVAEKANTVAQQAYADTTFTDAWKVDLGGETVSAQHWGPGHTSGDAVIAFEKANVVHGGDLLWHKFHPRVDTTAGASVVNWVVTLEKFSAQHDADTRYIFGHGQPAAGIVGSRADVLLLRDYLSAALDHVSKGLTAKQSKAEITAPPTLPRFEAWTAISQALTLATMLGAIYDELSVGLL